MVNFLDDSRDYQGIKLRRVKENLTEIFVPDPYYYKKSRTDYLPSTLPVWYNPKMEINRDSTILALATYINFYSLDNITYVEGLAGTGMRGFRVYRELTDAKGLPIKVIMNDVNPEACKLLKFNWVDLGTPSSIEIYCEDINYLLLHYRKKENGGSLDAIEVDPYGSPMPFTPTVAQVLKGKNGLFLASSTDLAPLHGKFPMSALRKYAAWVEKNKFDSEVATRVLMYALGKEFSIYSKRLDILFAFIYDGFIRIIARVSKGKLKANRFWTQVGFLEYDLEEPYNSRFVEGGKIGARGGDNVKYIGPLWIGSICNEEFCEEMIKTIKDVKIDSGNAKRLERFLTWAIEGRDIPLFVDVNDICRRAKVKPPQVNSLIEKLREKGIRCTRTFFNHNALKVENLQENMAILEEEIIKFNK